ncbi:farnesol dehydrogenase-like [Frankliniella occidentalis]|uniref:Farnesol dehydrogenase-like n=1 Tax=Frankliniella occidentalis TaxID=133901 RepID=A0A6J1TMQ5_FRAOC|nr:farnesol dehydrogenase-like [Frankliniella occidentalis]
MERWSGRVAVVTGASAGIGAAIVRDLASAGVRVVGLARREDKLQVLADELAGQGSPGELICVRCDVSDTSDVQAAFERIEEQVGAVSVLVNNAGVMIPQRVQDMSNEAMAAIVNTNILGLTSCCREVINNMKKHGTTDGHIVNINSFLGHYVPVFDNPDFSVAVYAGSKHAVTAICQGLRSELKHMHRDGYRIKVTSVSPGPVLTDMFGDDLRDAISPEEVQRLLKASDISRAVCFALASPPDVEMVEMTIQATGHLT